MRLPRYAFLLLTLIGAGQLAAQPRSRIASDFEIERMEQQLVHSRDFVSQLSARLNLGDLRLERNEIEAARAEYGRALAVATRERLDSRRDSDMSRYATATGYAGLASARLGDRSEAFALLEESLRYASDSAKSWNIYASAMTLLHKPEKAVSAARNAVAIAGKQTTDETSIDNAVDLAVYRYSLASSLVEAGKPEEAKSLLANIVASLKEPRFDEVRREIARHESFEIYSSARGREAAYISLLNRAQLRLAAIDEKQGDQKGARVLYESVLDARTDDETALAALARSSGSTDERERRYAEAFDANPFSAALILDYLRDHAGNASETPAPGESTAGARVRSLLLDVLRHRPAQAARNARRLAQDYPSNDSVRYLVALAQVESNEIAAARAAGIETAALRHDIERRIGALAAAPPPTFLDGTSQTVVQPSVAELQHLLELLSRSALSPGQRAALDHLTFQSTVSFDAAVTAETPAGQTVFEQGKIEELYFRFAAPVAFQGSFAPRAPLRLTYRVVGATGAGGRPALLLEPLRLEAGQ